jgi:hypothetical protein
VRGQTGSWPSPSRHTHGPARLAKLTPRCPAARRRTAPIRKDVAELVFHDEHIKRLRVLNEIETRRVHISCLRGDLLVGGLGLAPSAEIGDRHALFQPSHGTAPQLAGQDIANPLATILSGAMLLDWLGESRDDPAASEAGRRIEAAVARVLAEGRVRTRDLGGSSGTRAVGQAVVEAIRGAMRRFRPPTLRPGATGPNSFAARTLSSISPPIRRRTARGPS